MKRQLTRALLAITLLAALVAAPAGPASASTCIYPTFKVYPGSVPSGIRYGEVDFQVTVCTGMAASDFRINVTKQQVNATGKNLGFFIDGVSPVEDGIYTYTNYWIGHIDASTCLPRVGWPCSRSYSFQVELVGSLDYYGTVPTAWMGWRTAPSGMALYTTP